jgi:putative Mg2+ transporter-C (MgtC) family protein
MRKGKTIRRKGGKLINYIQFELNFIITMVLRLLAACIMGGIIGFQREYPGHRPAGLRTHILVCLGSALVMVTSEYFRFVYGDSFDVTRIGAQVVSGIGFLGAGAIIKQGFNVTGLTTAASLWAVACVGLACGSGFYTGAIFATVLIYIVLQILKIAKLKFEKRAGEYSITVETNIDTDIISKISKHLENNGLSVKKMHLSKNSSGKKQCIRYTVNNIEKMEITKSDLKREINSIEGVIESYIKKKMLRGYE